jgi:hypothetical protein
MWHYPPDYERPVQLADLFWLCVVVCASWAVLISIALFFFR